MVLPARTRYALPPDRPFQETAVSPGLHVSRPHLCHSLPRPRGAPAQRGVVRALQLGQLAPALIGTMCSGFMTYEVHAWNGAETEKRS
jgi:hypothetical protein